MANDVLNPQEVYDLSQTGDEVQQILNKSELLPTNPELQASLDAKQNVIPDLNVIRSGAAKGMTSAQQSETYNKGEVNMLLSQKQNVLTFDPAPTEGSQNPVTSDGIFSAIESLGTKTYERVDTLADLGTPTAAKADKIWLVGAEDAETFDRYVVGKSGTDYIWVPLGSTQIDLDQYASKTELENGTIVPAKAGTLESWEGASEPCTDIQETSVFTAGGDQSIDSSVPAVLEELVPVTDFKATQIVSSGFNLLRLLSNGGLAVALSSGYYFPVPKCEYGEINTASKVNGVLFTSRTGANLTPTVRFKALADGVPTSLSDGTVCSYTDASGYRFYNTPGEGYLIVSGITWADTCAHLGWSRRYSEFIAPDAAGDAGSSQSLTSLLTAIHADGKMLKAGQVADRIVRTGENTATWYRNVDKAVLTWANTLQEDGVTYLHEAAVPAMKADGAAEFESEDILLTISGQTVSYSDTNATGSTDPVKYELAAQESGTGSLSSLNIEDWGVIAFIGATGTVRSTIQYGQGIPDTLRSIASTRMPEVEEEIADIDDYVSGRIEAEEAQSADFDSQPLLGGQPALLFCEGAPTAQNKPLNWIELADGGFEWTGLPSIIGQQVRDITNGADYYGYRNPSTELMEWK